MSIDEEIHFFTWDDRRDIAHPGNRQKTLLFCVEHFINCAKEALRLHGHFSVALSGGSTPKALYEMLSKPPYVNEIDWAKVLLFWSDERNVPPEDPENNYAMAMNTGFKDLPLLETHIFRMEAEKEMVKNAQSYENQIRLTLHNRPFDLMMLGMGEDGHTASLFPNTSALEEKKHLVVANEVPQKNTHRMTMTFPLINQAKNIVVYVIGKKKQEMIRQVFLEKNTPPFPAEQVGTASNKALWILDSEAAKPLLEAKNL